ncbi:TRAP transporter substrate-binding protein [Acuticoccus sp. 2012]|uniref:TRAP transporter substrate-binding protein n=2 Tax=Acuticoccus mangrovi TaxID=2796142 RepID=A0A934IGP1_9HYPH|nr:TRAP transporter substrate-binding protein [Acuticoccus mangrovi]
MIVATATIVAGLGSASAQEITLRIQNHQSPESLSGKNIAQWQDDVETMSGGRVKIEMFYSSAIVKSVETFDAAINGIVDGDFTNGSYQTGKDPAFQFVSDIMGGYETPWQMYAWLYNGGGLELVQKLYNSYGMYLLAWQVPGMESLNAAKPLRGPEDLKDWKFRSPPGLETQIFQNLGASPVVIDFTEVFTSLETGIIDGADASNASTNRSLGIYDLAKHSTYPGFHSMPADHFALNLEVWKSLPEDIQRIMEVAAQKASFRTTLDYSVDIQKTVNELAGDVTFYDWSPEDRATFREGARKAWASFAEGSDAAEELVQSHLAFMKQIGLVTSGAE